MHFDSSRNIYLTIIAKFLVKNIWQLLTFVTPLEYSRFQSGLAINDRTFVCLNMLFVVRGCCSCKQCTVCDPSVSTRCMSRRLYINVLFTNSIPNTHSITHTRPKYDRTFLIPLGPNLNHFTAFKPNNHSYTCCLGQTFLLYHYFLTSFDVRFLTLIRR